MVLRLASLVLLAGCLASPAVVQAGSASLHITATIPALAQFRVVDAPSSLEITPEDVRRGHVDVALPCVVAARTNLAGGFAVRVLLDPHLVVAATVTGLAQAAEVAGSFALLRVPGGLWQETRYALHWRLHLAPGVQAGRYAWPVEMRLDGI